MKLFLLILIQTFLISSIVATETTAVTKHPRIGVACVVHQNGKILLGKRKGSHGSGDWATPGGHLEFGESVAACAARELQEETGLSPISLRLGSWVENVMENSEKHYITIFVYVDQFLGEPQLLEPNKCEGWEWFDAENLPQPLFSPIPSLIEKSGLDLSANFAVP